MVVTGEQGAGQWDRLVAQLDPHAQLVAARPLTGGVSAQVHALTLRLADGGQREVVVREKSGTVAKEYVVLKAARACGIPVPEPLLVDPLATLRPLPSLVMAFVAGESAVAPAQLDAALRAMATQLVAIHTVPINGLDDLPVLTDPVPEALQFLAVDVRFNALRALMRALVDTDYRGPNRLIQGDYWPGNLLWRDGELVAILDWEDAHVGDPLADVACARVEIRYRHGAHASRTFTRYYADLADLDPVRLALWDVYVASAALNYMGEWGLAESTVAHMREQATQFVLEAELTLRNAASGR
ncbi:MAG: phosphotransferase [Pseudomonadales bacterium]|nr:phosphotransferase [Pseudomonadales bacterium]